MDEFEITYPKTQKWYKEFQPAIVTPGNHDLRIIRKAASAGIPEAFLRNFSDLWDTPRWTYLSEFIEDGVYYFHGDKHGGIHPAWNKLCRGSDYSIVMGHIHSAGGVKWLPLPTGRKFGMDVGCLVDQKALAFAYAVMFKDKWCISASVVIDGHPYHEMMPCGPGERYSKAKFRRQR
jgi:hypothetical protein